MIKDKLEEAIAYLKIELAKIRAGRASIDLFENIEVDVYDSKLPMKQLATLSTPEPRVVIISPWDKNVLKDIENAVRSSMSDINPVIDGEVIRIVFPAPTEERRHELVRDMKKVIEEAKVKVRQIREDTMRELKEKEDKKEISEDELFKKREEAQELINEYNKKAEEMGGRKEEEIMKV